MTTRRTGVNYSKLGERGVGAAYQRDLDEDREWYRHFEPTTRRRHVRPFRRGSPAKLAARALQRGHPEDLLGRLAWSIEHMARAAGIGAKLRDAVAVRVWKSIEAMARAAGSGQYVSPQWRAWQRRVANQRDIVERGHRIRAARVP
jgi:hypothetical protein